MDEWDLDWLEYMDSEYPLYFDDYDDWGLEPLEWYDV